MTAHVGAYWKHWYDRWLTYTNQWEYLQKTQREIPPWMHPDFARWMKQAVELGTVKEKT
jgi:predicted alpha/beta hydrolase family esterase